MQARGCGPSTSGAATSSRSRPRPTRPIRTGVLSGRRMPFANRRAGVADILYVMATELEYGPELRTRITPLITGVGPVEAAASLTERLTRLSLEDKLPLLVVSLGSAGSAELEQCGLYQASEVSWRDMDATAFGFERGVVPFLEQPATQTLGPFVPGISFAAGAGGGGGGGGRAGRGGGGGGGGGGAGAGGRAGRRGGL